ncbi:MAG: transglycosylase SLT domain-containing protein [Candidatus Caldatribacteriaceae bacterium]
MKKIVVFVLSVVFFFCFARLEEVSSQLNDSITELLKQGKYERVVQLTEWSRWFKDRERASLRIIALLRLGRGPEARREILLLKDTPPPILDHIYYLYLEYLAQRGETSEMSPWLKKMEIEFSHSPLLPRAYLLHARALLERNRPADAILALVRVFTLVPSSEERQEAFLMLFRTLVKLDHRQEALLLLQKTYRDFPQRASEIKSLLHSIVVEIDLQGLSSEAEVAILEFLFALGFDNEVEKLADRVEKDALLAPLWRRWFALQARICLRSGNLEKLENLIRRAKGQNAEEILFYQGVLEQRKGQYPQAIQTYEKIVQLFPQGEYLFRTYQNIASCYLSWGKEQEYVKTLDIMTSLFPQEESSFWELFRFFYRRNRLSKARELMKRLAGVNGKERNRALFWLYKLGDSSEKKTYLEEILKSNDIDYYYVRAWQELKELEPHSPVIPFSENGPDLNADQALFSSESWRKYWFLQNIHLWENAEIELLSLHRNNPSLYLYLELSSFYERKGDYRKSILYALYLRNRLQNDSSRLFKRIEKRLYPRWFLELLEQSPSVRKFDPYLFLALVRAESSFQVDAISSAGAVGLAQLLPSTALWVIEKGWVDLGEKKVPSEKDTAALTYFLIRPEVNLHIGAAYFAYLLERFQGNLYLAICAYNAGPGRVSQWMEEFPSDLDAFVEFIPLRETQNYIRRVMTNYFFYSLLYRGDFSSQVVSGKLKIAPDTS